MVKGILYVKTHSEKIREAVSDLGETTPAEIMTWIKSHYPEDPVNPQSYRADIIGCSINHSSQHHYPSNKEKLKVLQKKRENSSPNRS